MNETYPKWVRLLLAVPFLLISGRFWCALWQKFTDFRRSLSLSPGQTFVDEGRELDVVELESSLIYPNQYDLPAQMAALQAQAAQQGNPENMAALQAAQLGNPENMAALQAAAQATRPLGLAASQAILGYGYNFAANRSPLSSLTGQLGLFGLTGLQSWPNNPLG